VILGRMFQAIISLLTVVVVVLPIAGCGGYAAQIKANLKMAAELNLPKGNRLKGPEIITVLSNAIIYASYVYNNITLVEHFSRYENGYGDFVAQFSEPVSLLGSSNTASSFKRRWEVNGDLLCTSSINTGKDISCQEVYLKEDTLQFVDPASAAVYLVTTRIEISPKAWEIVNSKNAKKIAKKAKPGPPTKARTSGSGFFVSKLGHIITNEHVVQNCGTVTVGDNAKKQVPVAVVETDKRNDLALLIISSTKMASADSKSLISKLGIEIVPLASEGLLRSKDVELGERVLVAGYPYGEIFSDTIKVTGGIVSANRGVGDDTGQFQMDAAVQPGNSGGPIYDENGNIVGVVVSQLNKMKIAKAIGSLPENVNFGIKASTVRQFLTASGLPTKWSKKSKGMSTKDLAKIAKNQTVMVVCNP